MNPFLLGAGGLALLLLLAAAANSSNDDEKVGTKKRRGRSFVVDFGTEDRLACDLGKFLTRGSVEDGICQSGKLIVEGITPGQLDKQIAKFAQDSNLGVRQLGAIKVIPLK